MAEKTQAGVEIILDRPGVVACGEYTRKKKYTVEIGEAVRLVDVKGFKLVNPSDQAKVDQHKAKIKAEAEAESSTPKGAE